MEQIGNIIQRQKVATPNAPTAKAAVQKTEQNASRNIATALLEFHKTNPHAFEDKRNPHFKNQYASLESVIKTVRTASQFGLTFTQEMDFEGDVTFVRTVMMHSSGDTRVSRTKIVSKDPNDPQKQGSAISYAKRYGLQSIFGLPSDDDDGEIANKAATTKPKNKPGSVLDLDKAIQNAKSIKELGQVWNKYQPNDFVDKKLKDATKQKFTDKRGELER
jgi:transcription elongation GreA/GreB family factor